MDYRAIQKRSRHLDQVNRKTQPLMILFLVVILLMLFSFIPKGTKIGSYTLKPVDMFSDIKPDINMELY